MKKDEFKKLFLSACNRAAADVEGAMEKPIPREFVVELHSLRVRGEVISVDDAIEEIFVNEGLFFQIIDVGIKSVTQEQSVIFARVSGHSPVDFGKTWDPKLFGPFKIISFDKINGR